VDNETPSEFGDPEGYEFVDDNENSDDDDADDLVGGGLGPREFVPYQTNGAIKVEI